jgi:hypothetical protein
MKMPNSFIRLFVSGAITISMFACNDDNTVKPPAPKPDGEALLENFEANIEELTQNFTVKAEDGAYLTGEQGTIIHFYPNTFTKQNGDPVTGNVDIEIVEIYKKSDMLFTKMATNGKDGEGNIRTLISGGEFFINATQNGEQLKVPNGFMIGAPVNNTGGADQDMRLFNLKEECTGNDCDDVWIERADGQRVEVGKMDTPGSAGTTDVYMAFQNQFGWTNIDRWYSDPRPKTTIHVDVPEGYDGDNCVVYLSYDGEATALARFDVYDSNTSLFTEHYGQIPIGLEVHFIMVSVVDGEWTYAIQSATIQANHVEVIGTPQSITEEELADLINDLP